MTGSISRPIQVYPKPYCPECGAQMELKRPPPGAEWKTFWGCSRYRDGCRGKRNILPDGTPEDDQDEFKPWDFE